MDWLSEPLNSSSKKRRVRSKSDKPYKPGPRDIGRVRNSKNWTPIEYKDEENDSGTYILSILSTYFTKTTLKITKTNL